MKKATPRPSGKKIKIGPAVRRCVSWAKRSENLVPWMLVLILFYVLAGHPHFPGSTPPASYQPVHAGVGFTPSHQRAPKSVKKVKKADKNRKQPQR